MLNKLTQAYGHIPVRTPDRNIF